MKLFLSLMVLWLMMPVSAVFAAGDEKPLPQLTGSDLETAQQMNTMYAQHLYSVGCMEKQKAYTMPNKGTAQEKVEWAKKAQAACDCMGEEVTKQVGANKVIDYATFMYGTRAPKKKTIMGGGSVNLSPEMRRVNDVSRDRILRQKCRLK